MNVGHPSNLARLVDLYGGQMNEAGHISKHADMDAMRAEIWSTSVSDEQTRQTIKQAWSQHELLLEPHGAVGWAGLQKYILEKGQASENILSVVLETAHPAKFPEEINSLLGFDPELPPSLQGIEEKTEQYDSIPTNYEDFKKYLLEKY
jgi:threonine synthase